MRLLGWVAVLALVLAACRSTPDDPAAVPTGPQDSPPAARSPVPDAPPDAPTVSPAPDDDPTALDPEDWSRLDDAPVGRTEVSAAAFGGQLWVAGGFTPDGAASDEVWIYDPDFGRWDAGPALPEALHHAHLVAAGEGLSVVGGYRGSGFRDPSAAMWRLDPASGQWVQAPALPGPRAAGAAAWDGTRVLYGGGVGSGGQVHDDVFAFDGSAWRRIGALSEAREHLGVASDGAGRTWFLGGRRGGMDAVLGAVDLVEGDRVALAGQLPTARGGGAGFYAPAVGACLVGGEVQEGTFAEVECLDADGRQQSLPVLGVARHGLGAAVIDGIAYVVMGGPEPGLTVSSVLEALGVEGERP